MARFITLFLLGGLAGAGVLHWWMGRAPETAAQEAAARAAPRLVAPALRNASDGVPAAAADDPTAALAAALELDDRRVQRREIERIAKHWASRDPLRAVAIAAELPGHLQLVFRSALDGAWAHLDPASYVAHLTAHPDYLVALVGSLTTNAIPFDDPRGRAPGIRELIASDPRSLLEVADALPSWYGENLRHLAVSGYAEREPSAAVAFVERMPRGPRRDAALASAAQGYARADAEAALAWVQSLSPQPAGALGNVLREIARYDVGRAIELALRPSSGAPIALQAAGALVDVAAADSAQAAAAAERLLSIAAPRRDEALSRLLSAWAKRDVEAMFSWLQRSGPTLPKDVLSSAAVSLATSDPAVAARFTERVPSGMRATWIAQTARVYAIADPVGAIDWLSRYEGQSDHETGMRFAFAEFARRDPDAAARALESVGGDARVAAAGVVADVWGQRDPQAAVQWAASLSDSRMRAAAVPEAVGKWSSKDAQAAEDWTLARPPGEERDKTLYLLLRGRRYTQLPREAYSTNPTAALVSRIGDAALREEVEQWFDD